MGRTKDLYTHINEENDSTFNNVDSDEFEAIKKLIDDSHLMLTDDEFECEICKSKKNVYPIDSGLVYDQFGSSHYLCEEHGIRFKLTEIQLKFGVGKSVIEQYEFAKSLYNLHVDQLKNHNNETEVQLKTLYSYIRNFSSPRKIMLYSFDHIKRIEAIEEIIPNAGEFLDHVKLSIYSLITKKENVRHRISPVLMIGDPGLGKTHVMHQVAKVLNMEYADIQLPNLHSSMEFSGLPPKWKTPSIGLYAKILSKFESHSAIIFLDELDKVKINTEHGSIFESLLILLEISTCSKYRDALIDLPMDSDNIFFIATANNLETIPKEILSRFTVIEIKHPSPSQMKNIINNLYEDEVRSWLAAGYECKSINKEIYNLLQGYSVRDVKKIISEAVNRSAYDNVNTNKKRIELNIHTLLGKNFFDEILDSLESTDFTMH